MAIPEELLEQIRSRALPEHRNLVTKELFDPMYDHLQKLSKSNPAAFAKFKSPGSVERVAKTIFNNPIKSSAAKMIDAVGKFATSEVESKAMAAFPKAIIKQFEEGKINRAQAQAALTKFLKQWSKYKLRVAKPFKKAMNSAIQNVSKLIGTATTGAGIITAADQIPKAFSNKGKKKKKPNSGGGNKPKPGGGGNMFVSGGNF